MRLCQLRGSCSHSPGRLRRTVPVTPREDQNRLAALRVRALRWPLPESTRVREPRLEAALRQTRRTPREGRRRRRRAPVGRGPRAGTAAFAVGREWGTAGWEVAGRDQHSRFRAGRESRSPTGPANGIRGQVLRSHRRAISGVLRAQTSTAPPVGWELSVPIAARAPRRPRRWRELPARPRRPSTALDRTPELPPVGGFAPRRQTRGRGKTGRVPGRWPRRFLPAAVSALQTPTPGCWPGPAGPGWG